MILRSFRSQSYLLQHQQYTCITSSRYCECAVKHICKEGASVGTGPQLRGEHREPPLVGLTLATYVAFLRGWEKEGWGPGDEQEGQPLDTVLPTRAFSSPCQLNSKQRSEETNWGSSVPYPPQTLHYPQGVSSGLDTVEAILWASNTTRLGC